MTVSMATLYGKRACAHVIKVSNQLNLSDSKGGLS